ncbi:MAG: Flp pilus assembly protein CpaB [Proteobacteria bacterium]|nr:Flp pilus assembly protein CpaB [Pseudomonadota bacterium]
MNRRAILLTSAILALFAVVLMQLYKRNLEESMGWGGETMNILVTTQTVRAWEKVDRSHLSTAEYPTQYLPPGAVPASMVEDIIGQTIGTTIPEGQAITTLHLANGNNGHRLSEAIPAGDRALTVRVGRTAFMDLVKPGDFVDVLVTLQDREQHTVETRTILQAVTVLAVGDAIGGTSEYAARGGGGGQERRSTDVTLAVSPREAEMLVLAQDQGELSMTLRFSGELDESEALEGWNLRDLLGREPIEEIQTVRDKRNCLVIQGAGIKDRRHCED